MRKSTILLAMSALLAAGCGAREASEAAPSAAAAEPAEATLSLSSLLQRVQLLAQRYGQHPGHGPMGWGPIPAAAVRALAGNRARGWLVRCQRRRRP